MILVVIPIALGRPEHALKGPRPFLRHFRLRVSHLVGQRLQIRRCQRQDSLRGLHLPRL
jgi:hypothetical protein